MRETDVAVIGGGLSGLCAAIAAAERGSRVVVVRRGLGTTAMSSGGLDFPADLPRLYGAAVGGAGAASVESLGAAAAFGDWLRSAGVELCGLPGEEMSLLDTAGSVRRTSLAPASHAAGRTEGWSGSHARLLLLGVAGYASFRPEWVRRSLVAAGLAAPDRVVTDRVAVLGLQDEADLPAVRLARALEEPRVVEAFAAAVARAARDAKASHVALPPVLGLAKAPEVYRTVTEASRAPVTIFELLSPPPSVPGQRLQDILDRLATIAGVEIVPGRAMGVGPATGPAPSGVSERSVLSSVLVESQGRTWALAARQFVLAAGKFVTGGLDAGGPVVTEPLFGLAVFVPPPPGWPPAELPAALRPVREMVYDRFAARHPIFEAGLAVDWSLRPLGSDGRTPLFANLRAAGSILGGYNHFTDGAGSGVAIATGVAAGRLAAEASRETAAQRSDSA